MLAKASRPRYEPKLILSRQGSLLARYGVALFSTGLAILIRGLLTPVWGAKFPFLTLFPAVLISAGYGGFGPGLISTVLSVFAALYFWISPTHSLVITQPADAVGLLLAGGVMLLILYLTDALARTNA